MLIGNSVDFSSNIEGYIFFKDNKTMINAIADSTTEGLSKIKIEISKKTNSRLEKHLVNDYTKDIYQMILNLE